MNYLTPETFTRKILSKKTGVYSFGVLTWEIFENGKIPFKGLTDLDIARKFNFKLQIIFNLFLLQIVNAEYLIFPTNTPKDFISKIIKNIFNVETKRFSMQKILIELNNIIKKSEEGANKLEAIENKGRKRK
uniref:Protein kinase domain-containing protein n=1 Tax=Meloidogyne incognita TaxID=6306 RepID=A0A914NGW3_MELIC